MQTIMKRVEQVKIISAKTEEALETAYNQWYRELHAAREGIPILQGQRIKIFDRRLTVHVSGKSRQLFLAVFYEHMDIPEVAAGGDRGRHLDRSGVSAVGRRMR